MRRRTVLGLAGAVLAAPAQLLAQRSQKVYRLGAFPFRQTPLMREHMRVFRESLKQLGFAEGRNLQIAEEYNSADPAVRRQSLSRLLRTKPDVILSFGSNGTLLAQEMTAGKIPVVFTIVGDPVAYGIVKELGRPGGNTTGVASLQREMTVKRLELVREMLPKAKRIVVAAYLRDITYRASESLLRESARSLGFELTTAELTEPAPELAVGRAIESNPDALFVYQPMSFVAAKIAQLAMARRIPVFFAEADLVARGGLLSYGPDFLDEPRRAADLVAKIFKGAKAGDLPIDQSSRYELVVNLKTAKALGLDIPPSVRPRIDRVIQ
jgi:putative tryptophan/tyrosine transport system substrate-binding protein